jgi:hypothetical protein
MAVPYTFGSATTSIPLSQLDSNFATAITLGNTAVQLGNTITTLTGVTNVASSGSLTLGTSGNTTAVTIDTSQNVLVGVTSSTAGRLAVKDVAGSGNNVWLIGRSSDGTSSVSFRNNADNAYNARIECFDTGTMTFATGTSATERMRIDSSGRVGIGMTSPTRLLDVLSASTGAVNIASFATSGAGGQGIMLGIDTTNLVTTIKNNTSSSYGMAFYSGGGGSESMRIDSSGNLLVGTTDSSNTSGPGLKSLPSTTVAQFVSVHNSSSAGSTGFTLFNTNATNNGYRCYIRTDGGIYNYSGNNVNLSDERTKTNIELSGNYLSKVCAIPVKLFNYKDETEGTQKTLGVIAQDVENHAPELVNNEGFGDTPEDGIPLKSVYTTDMMFALMKSIQELKSINDTQAETINALTARIVALEAK